MKNEIPNSDYGLKSQLVVKKLFESLAQNQKIDFIPEESDYLTNIKSLCLIAENRDYIMCYIVKRLKNCTRFNWFQNIFENSITKESSNEGINENYNLMTFSSCVLGLLCFAFLFNVYKLK